MAQTTLPLQKAPWIVVTGMDGSGKTTLIRRLKKEMVGEVFTFHVAYEEFVYPVLKFLKQHDDPYSERLLFALDARLTNHRLKTWRAQNDVVISDRGWGDVLIYGAVKGFSYKDISALLKLDELEQPSAIITLTTDVKMSMQRITSETSRCGRRSMRHARQFETRAFLMALRQEIDRFSDALNRKHTDLSFFSNIPYRYIDTTSIDATDVFRLVREFLRSALHVPFVSS